MPKVTGGLLDEAYPIKSRADVNRSRVLPLPRETRTGVAVAKRAGQDLGMKVAAAVRKRTTPAGEKTDPEQPQGGFDYVMKRNKEMKRMGISGRVARRSATRRA